MEQRLKSIISEEGEKPIPPLPTAEPGIFSVVAHMRKISSC
jgi:hypothetical protein